MMRFVINLFLKIFGKVLVGGPYAQKTTLPSSKRVVNIVITDLRDYGVRQKSVFFKPIIKKCLEENWRVNVLVPYVSTNQREIRKYYEESFSDYFGNEDFSLEIISKNSTIVTRLFMCCLVVLFLFLMRGNFFSRYNLSCLCSVNLVRILYYFNVFDLYKCDCWIGLSGNLELVSFFERKRLLNSKTKVFAIQFGQASQGQYHFNNYVVDRFFVYDEISKETYKGLGVDASILTVSGSPELEFYSQLIMPQKTGTKLNLLFIDQPVPIDESYSEGFLRELYSYLSQLSSCREVDFSVKRHPRGSAFRFGSLKSFDESDEIVPLLSSANLVISFYSNLCDLAVLNNRKTFYIKADKVLPEEKIKWVNDLGGEIVDCVSSLQSKVDSFKNYYYGKSDLPKKEIEMNKNSRASENIYSYMVSDGT